MGYLPYISFNWERLEGLQTIREKISYKEAQQYIRRLEEVQTVAYKNLEKAQKSMEQQANKYRRKPDFTIGDKVWVITKNQKIEWPSHKLDYKIEWPSYKLDYKIAGLYKILNKEGNLYKVKLLDLIKVHPIFLLDKLRKAINNLLPRQKNKPPLPI